MAFQTVCWWKNANVREVCLQTGGQDERGSPNCKHGLGVFGPCLFLTVVCTGDLVRNVKHRPQTTDGTGLADVIADTS